MRFTLRKRRNPPAVIIVSLIDILIVLLIFMMVTTTFKDIPALRLTLPETKQAAPKETQGESQPVIVTITTNSPYFFLGHASITLENLLSELTARAGKDPRLVLAIRADTMAAYGNVVKITGIVDRYPLESSMGAFFGRLFGKPSSSNGTAER